MPNNWIECGYYGAYFLELRERRRSFSLADNYYIGQFAKVATAGRGELSRVMRYGVHYH